MIDLRPPLAPPLSHDGITFVLGQLENNERLAEPIVAAIASALAALLPPGDFVTGPDGSVSGGARDPESAWARTGREESLRTR